VAFRTRVWVRQSERGRVMSQLARMGRHCSSWTSVMAIPFSTTNVMKMAMPRFHVGVCLIRRSMSRTEIFVHDTDQTQSGRAKKL
jgi:hypothetical protein